MDERPRAGSARADPDGTTNQEIGTGSITSSGFTDVDPGEREQWTCTFAYSATVTGTPTVFQVAVANLAPWVARADPTRPGEFVASVSTVADPAFFSQCTDDDFGDAVTEWSAAGQFWSNGISSVCSNGLHIEALDRPCRPPAIASDNVISVVRSRPIRGVEDVTADRDRPRSNQERRWCAHRARRHGLMLRTGRLDGRRYRDG